MIRHRVKQNADPYPNNHADHTLNENDLARKRRDLTHRQIDHDRHCRRYDGTGRRL